MRWCSQFAFMTWFSFSWYWAKNVIFVLIKKISKNSSYEGFHQNSSVFYHSTLIVQAYQEETI